MTEPDSNFPGDAESNFPSDNPETVLLAERVGQDVDHLTGLKQRASLERMLENKKAGTFSLLYIDMDNLKDANDKAKSHSLGDRALKTIADEITLHLRDRDSEGYDEAFRVSGDEFVVVLDKVTNVKDLNSIANRVKGSVGSHVFTYDKGQGVRGSFPLTVSIGASISLGNDISNDAVVGRADEALYKAKETKNAVVIFEEIKDN